MIYLFTGDDTKNKFINYEKFLKSISKDTEVFSVNRNNFSESEIESFYSGAGLFFTKCVVALSNILDREDERDFILKKLELFAQSPNTFIFLEGKLNKPVVDAFKKIKGEVVVNIFELPKAKKERFDNFLLANAFANKDKLNMWIYFRQAMDKGVMMEELTGVLFWKIKDMILKKNFSKYSEAKLKDTANKLSYLLPEARREGKDAEVVFEQFLLEVI
ncbi:MAG: hypothetical protein UU24_C0020G0006 [Candidatus Nomurabacteria bacterium GW2011_GWA2_40_9]|uniref:DNA polymerase III delta N-terminal domain-containing protein n=1 Tax=Candidatus Nomurabacteria bacterium GW2011_GWA2_40_9 TaxID=1618734 RepID=A0A0G0W430_9BACT|nr:MAG: hypothetical protein UU24_C0020G0006 [Candidatus Nomurabacteria bacterium GW2011_GWA2_40_9]